jgi:hypothetical protein
MNRTICFFSSAALFSVSAHASTLGTIHGISGWTTFLVLISVPNYLALMVALPFLVASSMKWATRTRIAVHVLIYEALAAGAGWLILYLVLSMK